jgi:hypothetical protein
MNFLISCYNSFGHLFTALPNALGPGDMCIIANARCENELS